MREIEEIILHCSATRPSWKAGAPLAEQVAEIRRWHVQENGWSDIGYHFVVGRNGEAMAGRPLERVGAHVIGRNRRTIGICLIGGHGAAAKDQFIDHFTPSQDRAVRKLIGDLMERFGKLDLSGHNQWSAKGCPGFSVPKWWGRK